MLNNEELYSVKAGAVKWAVIGGVGVLVTLLVGIVDGYIRPLKCNN